VATVISGTHVELEWTDNADNETQFAVERCAGVACANFVEVGTTVADDDTYSDNALTLNNNYRWRVRARNQFGTSAYTAIVSASTFGPTAPTTLTATTIGATQIDVVWSNDLANADSILIERCTDAGCSAFAQIAAVAFAADDTVYSDLTTVYGQSYTYQLRTRNAVTSSSYTPTATATTLPPAAPSALSGAPVNATRIDLAWTDNSNNETGFRIERCPGDACSNFAEIATVAANATTYQDLAVAFNTGYRYRVRAYHAITSVDYSNIVNADTRPPTAPTALTATTTSATSITLAWADNADDELSYRVDRCVGGACTEFAQIGTAVAGATGYVDNTAVVGTSYRYQVTAIGVPGNSAASNIASANTLLPADPTANAATTITAMMINVTWIDNSDNETGFVVQRCTGAGCSSGFATVATMEANDTTHVDSTATPGSSYGYRVRAFNAAGNSGFSATLHANTLPPADPTGLSATTVSDVQIDLAWTNNAPEAETMRIERCTGVGCSDFAEITVVPAAQVAYSDFGGADPVALNNTYSYRVRAQNAADVSNYSNEATATTLEAAAPATLTTTMVAGPGVRLDWIASAGPGVTGYEVQRCTGAACSDFAFLANTSSVALLHVDTDVVPGADYVYRVRASNIVGPGPFSDIAAGNTRFPNAPSVVTATVLPGHVSVTWQDNADNETSFVLMRCEGAACVPIDYVSIFASDSVAFDDQGVGHSPCALADPQRTAGPFGGAPARFAAGL
jgi:fibronectin type 3 domain-containing protein